MKYPAPNQPDSPLQLQSRYQNYIGGKYVDPVGGNYFTDTSPVDGSVIGEFPRSDAKDIDLPWMPPTPPLVATEIRRWPGLRLLT